MEVSSSQSALSVLVKQDKGDDYQRIRAEVALLPAYCTQSKNLPERFYASHTFVEYTQLKY